MNPDDPFFNPGDADRTVVVKPNPGGQRNPAQAPPPGYVPPVPQSPPPAAPMETLIQTSQQPQMNAGQMPMDSYSVPDNPTSSNALTDAGAKILALIGRLKVTPQHRDVNSLHSQVVQELQSFDSRAMGRGASSDSIYFARYALCASIDEAVLNTPWGSNSVWSHQSMLSKFYQETGGGEKFFQILEKLKYEPGKNADVLELYSLCIALGFEGKYRIMENGRSYLDSLRDEVYRILRGVRGDFERDLSPHWKGLQTKTSRLSQVPLWAVGAIAGAAMFAIYLGFNVILHQSASPIYTALENISPSVILKEDQ